MRPLRTQRIGKLYPNALILSLLLLNCACEKSEDDLPAAKNDAIFYPFRLANNISDNNSIAPLSLFIDSKKQKWITWSNASGRTGIIRFDGNLGDSYPNPQVPLPLYERGELTAQTEDANGAIYFTSHAGNFQSFRLLRYQGGSWTYWSIEGIPCREIYFNEHDGNLYFVFLDQVHRISPNENFSDINNYERIQFSLPGSPLVIQSNFDGRYIHFLSEYRYYVISTEGELLFHTDKYNDINFSYFFASDPKTAAYTIGGSSRQGLFKLHEGRWARYPVADIGLNSITVDQEEKIYFNAVAPDYFVGKYDDGEIEYFTYGTNQKKVASTAPVVVDKSNVKWVAVYDGLVRLP